MLNSVVVASKRHILCQYVDKSLNCTVRSAQFEVHSTERIIDHAVETNCPRSLTVASILHMSPLLYKSEFRNDLNFKIRNSNTYEAVSCLCEMPHEHLEI